MFVRVSFCLFCDLKILAVTERHRNVPECSRMFHVPGFVDAPIVLAIFASCLLSTVLSHGT